MVETSSQGPVQFYVLKRGEMVGPFSEEDLRTGLAEGQFEVGDFVQVGGEVAWQPLGGILGAPEGEMTGAVAPTWRCLLKWAWLRLRYSLDKQAPVAGLVCLLLGTLSLALSHWPFVFWIPWFLATTVAGVGLIMHKREGLGALLLAGVICIIFLFQIYGPKAPWEKKVHTGRSEPVVEARAHEPALLPPVAQATPVPPASGSIPVGAPLPSSPRSADDVALAARPVATPAPATPAPDSLLTTAGKIAESVVPFYIGTKVPLPSSPSLPPSAALPVSPTLPSPSTETPAPVANVPKELKVPGTAINATPLEPDSDFLKGHHDAFVIVAGTNGSGSGFACRLGDKTWLFSNIHVVAEIKQPTITQFDGVVVVPGAAEVAAGPDIARFALPRPPAHPLEAITDFEHNVHSDDEIAVLGNSGGGGVVVALTGKVVGIGPDRLEVSAPFIPGNSGSPIVHLKTGKVIGIATYLTRRSDEFGPKGNGGAPVVRRFGYRIDKVPAWEPVNWGELYLEADQIEQVGKLTEDIFNFLDSLRTNQEPNFATETLRRPATEWRSKIRGSHFSETDRLNATQSFLNALRFMVRGDVAVAGGRLRYTYFRSRLAEEQVVRDGLYKAFDAKFNKVTAPLGTHR